MLVSIAHKSRKGTGKTWRRTDEIRYIRVDGNTPISVRLTRQFVRGLVADAR